MKAILKKELRSFFSSSTAYLVIGFFLGVNGFFLWVFNDDFNILNAGFADLNNFFSLAPWVFMFLIPAITMKTFAGEFQTGTIEILKTRPISNWQLVFGKFLSVVILIGFTLVLTWVYVYSINQLGSPVGNIDYGSTIASYLGLLLLVCAYTAIGLFTSTLSSNQIIAFLLAVLILFFFYYGVDAMANLFGTASYTVQLFGMTEHFKSISRGVIDTRDVLYFISLSVFFLFITKQTLSNE